MTVIGGKLSIAFRARYSDGYFCYQTSNGSSNYCGVERGDVFRSGEIAKLKVGYLSSNQTVTVIFTPLNKGYPALYMILQASSKGSGDLRRVDGELTESHLVHMPFPGVRDHCEPIFNCDIFQRTEDQFKTKDDRGNLILKEMKPSDQTCKMWCHKTARGTKPPQYLGTFLLKNLFHSSVYKPMEDDPKSSGDNTLGETKQVDLRFSSSGAKENFYTLT